ncbi:MAG: hypothetical protein WCW03_00540 [Candidatus Paceibacterota bacterium]
MGDTHVNRVLAGNSDPEDECFGQLCSDGLKRNLWRCSHDLITRLNRAATENKMHFRIYRKRGNNGEIEPWRFETLPHPVVPRRNESIFTLILTSQPI